jgi:hypothetical protein
MYARASVVVSFMLRKFDTECSVFGHNRHKSFRLWPLFTIVVNIVLVLVLVVLVAIVGFNVDIRVFLTGIVGIVGMDVAVAVLGQTCFRVGGERSIWFACSRLLELVLLLRRRRVSSTGAKRELNRAIQHTDAKCTRLRNRKRVSIEMPCHKAMFCFAFHTRLNLKE